MLYFTALRAGATLALLPEAGYLYTERIGTISEKRSDVSRTNPEYARMEAQARRLAAECDTELLLRAELVRRAEAIRILARWWDFLRRGSEVSCCSPFSTPI